MQPIAQTTPERARGGNLRRMLSQAHERLEGAFADLLAAFKADARDAARLWNAFDDGLRTHLQLEEQNIFPPFGRVHAAEVAALEDEHGYRDDSTDIERFQA